MGIMGFAGMDKDKRMIAELQMELQRAKQQIYCQVSEISQLRKDALDNAGVRQSLRRQLNEETKKNYELKREVEILREALRQAEENRAQENRAQGESRSLHWIEENRKQGEDRSSHWTEENRKQGEGRSLRQAEEEKAKKRNEFESLVKLQQSQDAQSAEDRQSEQSRDGQSAESRQSEQNRDGQSAEWQHRWGQSGQAAESRQRKQSRDVQSAESRQSEQNRDGQSAEWQHRWSQSEQFAEGRQDVQSAESGQREQSRDGQSAEDRQYERSQSAQSATDRQREQRQGERLRVVEESGESKKRLQQELSECSKNIRDMQRVIKELYQFAPCRQLCELLINIRQNVFRDADEIQEDLSYVTEAFGIREFEPGPGDSFDPKCHEQVHSAVQDIRGREIEKVYSPGFEMDGEVIVKAQVSIK